MKTKLLIIGLFAVILSSCSSPLYLPDAEDIDVNLYGSYISLIRMEPEIIDGELLAVDSSKFIVLVRSGDSITKIIKIIPVKEVTGFSLQYAHGNDYTAAIPLFSLVSLAHGLYAVATLPFNLVYTIVVAGSSKSGFTYSEEQISIDQLRMFARFPQGIPPGINIRSIK